MNNRKDGYLKYLNEIRAYIENEAFQELLHLYGFTGEKTGDLYQDLSMYASFAEEKWDFRKKHNGEERSSITADDTKYLTDWKRTVELLSDMRVLNTGDIDAIPIADYVLPLGGASDSNRTRMILAKDACDSFQRREPEHKIYVCALSAERQLIRQTEIDSIEQFAPGARTEYDALTGGMKCIFGLSDPSVIRSEKSENPNLCWKLSEFPSADKSVQYFTLSAPSSDPEHRRANTLDTFLHFLEQFDVKEGASILLCSTAIYKAYQLTSLMPYALDRGIDLYFAGRPSNPEKLPETFVPNILQEVNAGLKTMKLFAEKYRQEFSWDKIRAGIPQ